MAKPGEKGLYHFPSVSFFEDFFSAGFASVKQRSFLGRNLAARSLRSEGADQANFQFAP